MDKAYDIGEDRDEAERRRALEWALKHAKDDDAPRWVVAMAETFRKYVESGELQG